MVRKAGTQIAYIQALRAIAVLTVVLHHLTPGEVPFKYGYLGVDLFFVVSGLIMVRATDGLFGPIDAAAFMVRRLCRIWPTYAVLSVIALLVSRQLYVDPFAAIAKLIASIAFVPMWGMQPTIPPGWSLVFEVYFYFVIALSMLAGRLKWVAMFALLAPWMVFTFDTGADPSGLQAYLALVSQPIIWCFILGVAVGLIEQAGWSLPRAIATAGVLCTAMIAVFLFWSLPPKHGVVEAALLSVTVLMLALANNQRSISVHRFIVWIGNISFSIYLVHEPFLHLTSSWWLYGVKRFGPSADIRLMLSIPASMSVIILLAVLSRKYLEVSLSNTVRSAIFRLARHKNTEGGVSRRLGSVKQSA